MKKTWVIALLLLALTTAVYGAVPSVNNTVTVTSNNSFTANGDGTATTVNAVTNPVPTLSTIGLVTLTLLLAGYAVLRVRRQARRTTL
jgi:hypothetical protein